MKTLVVSLFLLPLAALGQITNLTFTWDVSPNAEVYRFWNGSNAVLLGTVTTNRFTVTNWDTRLPRTISVTASNEIGESAATVKPVKAATTAPQNLGTIPLSVVTPVPGVIEISQNLTDWSQRIRVSPGSSSTNVSVTWVQYPIEPVMFMRSRTVPPVITPPLP